ncbi:MAG: ABC transporter permease [archaeon]
MEKKQFKGIIFKNLAMKRKKWIWQLSWIFNDIIFALSIGLIGYGINSVTNISANSTELTLFLVIGSFMWSFLNSVFSTIAEKIHWETRENTIEYTLMAPMKRIIFLASTAAFGIIWGLVRFSILMITVIVFFNLELVNLNPLSVMIMIALSAIAMSFLGIMVSILPMLWPERGITATHIVRGTLMFVSGIFYPITVLPETIQVISRLSPVTYALQGTREAVINNATITQLFYTNILPLIAITIILIPLSLIVFSLTEKYVKKTGRLARTG